MSMKAEPIKRSSELLKYIPQRPPFVMVDKLYETGADFTLSGLLVTEENALVKQGFFTEAGLVENMAQTAALMAGLEHLDKGMAVPLGYIAGVKDLEVLHLPAVGAELYTKMVRTQDIMNIQVVEGTITDAEENLIARCELRIFIKGEE